MRIVLGLDAIALKQGRRVPVTWDTERLINGHMLLVGKSGTGKTTLLRNMLGQLIAMRPGRLRVHVFDVHGDIEVSGASTVLFSEATPYGFNPLMVNPDPHFGGVRKRIQSFMAAIKRSGYQLGSKQEAALRSVLSDLYAASGFYEDRPSTWRLHDGSGRATPKKQPTVDDAVRYANYKLRAMTLGTSSKAVDALEQLYRRQRILHNRIKRAGQARTDEDVEKLKEEIAKRSDEVVDLFREHLTHIQAGHELDDLIKYDSRDVMKSVVERLENLKATGIFRAERPPFDPKCPIWRYNIKALSSTETRLFVSLMLEAIHVNATQRGLSEDLVEIIVLDEAHMFFDDEPDNPINTIAKEARKFGLGLFCSSQSPTHFSDDFISNVGTKVILGIDQMFWDGSVRKLKVSLDELAWIVAQKSLLVQMNNRGELRNQFLRVATEA